jgi:hypothetical protein
MKPMRLFSALVFLALFTVARPASAKPLQVYILAGQSNMQGHAKVSTFEHIGMDPATKPMLAEMTGPDGKPKVCERVWISSIGCLDTDQVYEITPSVDSIGRRGASTYPACAGMEPTSRADACPHRPRAHAFRLRFNLNRLAGLQFVRL